MTLQRSEVLALSAPPLEGVVRGSARHLFLRVLVRVVTKRRF